jgi:hypothetical protein
MITLRLFGHETDAKHFREEGRYRHLDWWGHLYDLRDDLRTFCPPEDRDATPAHSSNLVEGDADPFLLAPDDMTGNVRAVRLKDKIEAHGDVVGASNLECRTRNGNVAD